MTMRSKTVRLQQHTAYSEKKRNYTFLANMRSVFLLKTQKETVCLRRYCFIRKNFIMWENFTFNFKKFLNSGLLPCLLLNDAKKNVKNDL
jgi:hypothetical protein